MTSQPRDAEDLTARARIRDAALARFAERGMQGATVRDIARAAGVSAALVRHHFGTKEELRDACDAYVVERLVGLKQDALDDGLFSDAGVYAAFQPAFLPLLRYLSRAMVDGSPGAAAIFDRLVERTEAWLVTNMPGYTEDARAVAAVIVAMQSGLTVMNQHVSRALGADVLGPEGHPRMSMALFDLFSTPMIDPETAARARTAMAPLRERIARPATADPS